MLLVSLFLFVVAVVAAGGATYVLWETLYVIWYDENDQIVFGDTFVGHLAPKYINTSCVVQGSPLATANEQMRVNTISKVPKVAIINFFVRFGKDTAPKHPKQKEPATFCKHSSILNKVAATSAAENRCNNRR